MYNRVNDIGDTGQSMHMCRDTLQNGARVTQRRIIVE